MTDNDTRFGGIVADLFTKISPRRGGDELYETSTKTFAVHLLAVSDARPQRHGRKSADAAKTSESTTIAITFDDSTYKCKHTRPQFYLRRPI